MKITNRISFMIILIVIKCTVIMIINNTVIVFNCFNLLLQQIQIIRKTDKLT